MKLVSTLIAVFLLPATLLRAEESSESKDLRSYHRNILQHRVARTSKLWPNNIPQYCIDYGYLIQDAEPMVKSPYAMPLLEELVLPLLEKSNPQNIALSKDCYYRLWKVQADALERLLGTANRLHVSGDDRVRYVAMVISFMKRLNQEIIPDFKGEPGGIYSVSIGGTDKSSDDARKALRKAQEQSAIQSDIYSKQRFFGDTAKQLNLQLSYFLKETKSKYPDLMDQIEMLSADKQP